jgi:hypothetical protein
MEPLVKISEQEKRNEIKLKIISARTELRKAQEKLEILMAADPLDKHTIGSHITEDALKDPRQTRVAELSIGRPSHVSKLGWSSGTKPLLGNQEP